MNSQGLEKNLITELFCKQIVKPKIEIMLLRTKVTFAKYFGYSKNINYYC